MEKIDLALERLCNAADELKVYRACREEQDRILNIWYKAVVLDVLGLAADGKNGSRIERVHADEMPKEHCPNIILYCGEMMLMRFATDSNMVRRAWHKEAWSLCLWESLRELNGLEYWAEIYDGSEHWLVVPEETRRKMKRQQRIKRGGKA